MELIEIVAPLSWFILRKFILRTKVLWHQSLWEEFKSAKQAKFNHSTFINRYFKIHDLNYIEKLG